MYFTETINLEITADLPNLIRYLRTYILLIRDFESILTSGLHSEVLTEVTNSRRNPSNSEPSIKPFPRKIYGT